MLVVEKAPKEVTMMMLNDERLGRARDNGGTKYSTCAKHYGPAPHVFAVDDIGRAKTYPDARRLRVCSTLKYLGRVVDAP
jgi:hypothetical protein